MKMLRESVAVDDQWHLRALDPAAIRYVACRTMTTVEFWFVEGSRKPAYEYRVFGTGHNIDDFADNVFYVGTALSPAGGDFVWHLFTRRG